MKTWQKVALSLAVIGVTGTLGVFVVYPWVKKTFFPPANPDAGDNQGTIDAGQTGRGSGAGQQNPSAPGTGAGTGKGPTVGGPRPGINQSPTVGGPRAGSSKG